MLSSAGARWPPHFCPRRSWRGRVWRVDLLTARVQSSFSFVGDINVNGDVKWDMSLSSDNSLYSRSRAAICAASDECGSEAAIEPAQPSPIAPFSLHAV